MVLEDGDSKEFKLKPMKCELNFLTKADGSAILSQGDTVALVSVNGPLDIKQSSQNMEKATLEVIYSPKSGKTSIVDRYKEHVVRQNCEAAIISSLYPRTGITVTVQEMEDAGGLISCSVNCCCLALLNCGVPMRNTFAAVTCGLDAQGNVVLEPVGVQMEALRALMTFVFDGRTKSLVSCATEGNFSEVAYREAMEKCRAASDLIFAFYRSIVKQYSTVL